jgi:putative nucleotidyltransferase with HDIG domain
MKTAAEIRDEIESLSAIPTLPTVLADVLKLIDREDVSVNQIGDFISEDQALSARVLKMVNSPIYGFPGRISSINQALMLIGLGVLKGMLTGVAIFDVMQKTMVGLWEHSIGAAAAARIIAQRAGMKEVEEASVAGLIHDLGKVALGVCYPAEFGLCVERARAERKYIFDLEREIMGVSHAEAGSWLARKWNFPRQLVEAVAYHHKPRLAKEAKKLAATVHLADAFIKMTGFGFGGDPLVHPVDEEAWAMLGLGDDDVKDILLELEDAISGTVLSF